MKTTPNTLTSLLKQGSLHARQYLLAGLLLVPLSSPAADIDIYSGLTGDDALPNVLLVLDNAASFSASADSGHSTCSLTNTATGVTANNSLAGKAAGIEQCALYSVIKGLPTDDNGTTARVNIGFMVYNANNLNANCPPSANGGCLVYPLQPMTAAKKQEMMNWITTWQISGGAGNIKVNGSATAATMQEAWAYYAGRTGLSGRSYTQPEAGCQKNFVIFIGNSYGSAGTPGDAGSASPAAALTAAYGATPVPSLILGTKNTTCGSYTFPPGASTHEGKGHYADEWARFMHYSADIYSATSGRQNITTYTIGVLGAQCQAEYAAQLDSMAAYGGGKYFATTDQDSIVQALLRILNEVQAVNSVFSSATLPVSVNTQGTYLNQIYMGMFRPDSAGTPRWVGNVKQYQFWFDANKKLYLADAGKQAAISSAGTGFIAPDAASFWSCRSSANADSDPALASPYNGLTGCALDPAGGFWQNYPDYVANTAGGAFDLSDGEVVEKGGAGQQLRLANLTNNSPRKLYTYCPSGSGCTAALSDAANAFATSNTNITAAMFGTGVNLTITSINLNTTTGIATATTSGTHNLVTGNTLTIVGASPNDYNGLVTVTRTGSNTFTYPVQVYPPVNATGSYVASQSGAMTSYPLTSLTRVPAGNSDTATVTATMTFVPFADNASVTIGGATPSVYNLSPTINWVNNQTFEFPITVNPPKQSTGEFVVSLANAAQVNISSYSCNNGTKRGTVTTGIAHGLRTGDQITISGDTSTGPSDKLANGTFNILTVSTPTTFTYDTNGCPGTPTASARVQGGPLSPLPVTLTRNETAVGTATVTATIGSSNQFASGDLVNITAAPSTTTPPNKTGYLLSSQVISCSSTPCGTTFSFTIATTPAQQPGGSITVTGASATALPTITSLSRTGNTATATVAGGAGFAGFVDGAATPVTIQTAPGTTLAAHEEAYTGSYTITCDGGVSPCTTFTYGPLTITPAAAASGTITASNSGLTPDRDSLINWIRGEDNFGDEKSLCPPGVAAGTANCPSTRVTVRPSVHGDALHSRPIALNYGGSTGVVVYYGTNDGVYHAINGNQTAAIGSTAAGGELWGFIARDFYDKFNRQRSNSPLLLLPSTQPGIFPAPQPKDYFIDGPTGMYQTIDGNGITTKAIIYIAARRGGRFIHAVDVTDPSDPQYLWKISDATAGFAELGQTWSQPKVAWFRGYTNPVLIFGAGYDDGSEDQEPPLSATLNGSGVDMGSDNMGRGIFIADALTGRLVWHARHYSAAESTDGWVRTDVPGTKGAACTGTPPAAVICDVRGMNYSIPADVSLMDKDQDGFIERLYASDNGGNVWRLDFEPAGGVTPDKWQVTQLAALGCPNGPCSAALATNNLWQTQRKFFFPPEVIALRSKDYDAVFVGSGDREHPLLSQAAYNVTNRLYMLKDFNKGKDSVSQVYPISELSSLHPERKLADCTGGTCSTATTGADTAKPYCDLTNEQQRSGYYFTLEDGEKVVNAPLTTAGYVYFGTNQPAEPEEHSCSTNLGIARGYQLSPFCAQYASVIFEGGGLPPSPVSGIVDIINEDRSTTHAPFCVGCATPLTSLGGEEIDCKSSLAGCSPKNPVSNKRRRNYWYINNK